MESWKEKVLKRFTNDLTHFGNTTTLHVESRHMKIKYQLNNISVGKIIMPFLEDYIYENIGNLRSIVNAIKLILINQQNNFLIWWKERKTCQPK